MVKKARRGGKKSGTDWPGPRWSDDEVRELKTLARQKTPARIIGRKLGRTEGAVRQKAYEEGVALRSGRDSRKRK
jgi:hypothetical protein